MTRTPRLKLAVVGAGVSGLVAAHVLDEAHDVTLLEIDERPGGHTHTVEVRHEGEAHRIDTGFIVFNELNYPLFSKLLTRLGVGSRTTSMSFSVRCERTGLEYNGTSLRTIFAQKRNLLRPSFHRMLLDILRFHREAPGLAAAPAGDDSLSVEDFVQERGYSVAFAERYLVPLGASLWSAPPESFRRFPIRFVAEFLQNHKMLQVGDRPVWRVVEGGSSRYVEAILRSFQGRLRLSSGVRSLLRAEDHVRVRCEDGTEERFDEVIVACHADQARRLLADPSPLEEELLGAFPYQPNEAVLHTDTSVLPRRRAAWASWNYRIPAREDGHVRVTYNMNLLQGLGSPATFCVTLNGAQEVAPERVLRRIQYRHPVYTRHRATAQRRHGELLRHRRTSYCGAYWGYGFHEDGVRSSLAVCEVFGRTL